MESKAQSGKKTRRGIMRRCGSSAWSSLQTPFQGLRKVVKFQSRRRKEKKEMKKKTVGEFHGEENGCEADGDV